VPTRLDARGSPLLLRPTRRTREGSIVFPIVDRAERPRLRLPGQHAGTGARVLCSHGAARTCRARRGRALHSREPRPQARADDRLDPRGTRDRSCLVRTGDLRATGHGNLAGSEGAFRPNDRLTNGRRDGVIEVVSVLQGIPAPEDRWDAARASGLSALDALVY